MNAGGRTVAGQEVAETSLGGQRSGGLGSGPEWRLRGRWLIAEGVSPSDTACQVTSIRARGSTVPWWHPHRSTASAWCPLRDCGAPRVAPLMAVVTVAIHSAAGSSPLTATWTMSPFRHQVVRMSTNHLRGAEADDVRMPLYIHHPTPSEHEGIVKHSSWDFAGKAPVLSVPRIHRLVALSQ